MEEALLCNESRGHRAGSSTGRRDTDVLEVAGYPIEIHMREFIRAYTLQRDRGRSPLRHPLLPSCLCR